MSDASRQDPARVLLHRYGLLGSAHLAFRCLVTKLLYRPAALIRSPFYIRGATRISLGKGMVTGRAVRIDAFANDRATDVMVHFGEGVQINDNVHIAARESVKIGNRVLIAGHVFISDHDHGTFKGDGEHDSPLTPPAKRKERVAPVHIEDDVWIGEFVSVLMGVTIGKGSIIGTMSVVTRDIPPYSIAVGAPARVIKRYNFESARWEAV